jgi:hypothetical protein
MLSVTMMIVVIAFFSVSLFTYEPLLPMLATVVSLTAYGWLRYRSVHPELKESVNT